MVLWVLELLQLGGGFSLAATLGNIGIALMLTGVSEMLISCTATTKI